MYLQKRCTSLWFMSTSFPTCTYRRDVHPFGSCERHSLHVLTEEMYIPLVHVNVIPYMYLQKRCTSLWFMSTSFPTCTYRRDVHPFGSCQRHSLHVLTEEMYIPLVHVNVIPYMYLQKRCTSLWFMSTSFPTCTYRRDVHPFGSCQRHSLHVLTEEMYIPLVHVNVIPYMYLQKRCTSLWFMSTSFPTCTYRRDVHPFGSCQRHSLHVLTEEMYIPLVHVNVIPYMYLQKRLHPFGSCQRHSPHVLTEEMCIHLVHVNVIPHMYLQKRCTSLWFMSTSFRTCTYRTDVHPFGSCERHSLHVLTEQMYIPLVHVNVIQYMYLQNRCTPLWFM